MICRSNNIHYLRYKIVIKTSIGDYTELDSLIVLQLFDPVDYYTRSFKALKQATLAVSQTQDG